MFIHYRLQNVYGMTENGCATFQSCGEETIEQMTETVGLLNDHLEAKIIDRQGRTVPMGVPGELCIRGFGTMLHYYKDEARTNDIYTEDRWLKTGYDFIQLFEWNEYVIV